MAGHKPADRIKLETKKHFLIDKNVITQSVNGTSLFTHEVTVATDIVESIVIK
jgi:hypothetical protein